MSWKHTLPLTFINGSQETILMTLHHKQGDAGNEQWTVKVPPSSASAEPHHETSYGDHGDSWWASCQYDGGPERICEGHHWGVEGEYVGVTCTIYKDGFTMTGFKDGGGSPSHHYFGWK